MYVHITTVFCQTDLIVAAGDRLEFLTDGSMYRTLTLNSYNASKLSALAYDATTRKLFFSDRHHLYGHIFSVSLEDGSHRLVEDIVESIRPNKVDATELQFLMIIQETITRPLKVWRTTLSGKCCCGLIGLTDPFDESKSFKTISILKKKMVLKSFTF